MRTFFFGNKTKTTTSLFFSIHDGVNVRNTLISDQQLHIIYIIEENNYTHPPPPKKGITSPICVPFTVAQNETFTTVMHICYIHCKNTVALSLSIWSHGTFGLITNHK